MVFLRMSGQGRGPVSQAHIHFVWPLRQHFTLHTGFYLVQHRSSAGVKTRESSRRRIINEFKQGAVFSYLVMRVLCKSDWDKTWVQLRMVSRNLASRIAHPYLRRTQRQDQGLRIPDGSKLVAEQMRKAIAINEFFEKRLTVFRKEPLISWFIFPVELPSQRKTKEATIILPTV